jgi:hypothetical protein
MRCKTCQYPLWNLSGRVCPECGSPFAPSEFSFALNSVRFMCPHCAQAYYGTDPRGHLVPREFGCVRCGRHIQMDEMVLLPTEGVAEERTRAEPSPWLERGGRGPVARWFVTARRALFQPTRLMRSTPLESSAASAAGFALVTNGVFVAVNLGILVAWSVAAMSAGGGFPVVGLMTALIGWGVGLAVAMGVWVLVAHGLLMVTGETAGGIGRTAQAICYSSATNILTAAPCIGPYLGPISLAWWAVCATVMTIEAQKVRGWRATVAVAGPPLTLVGLLVAGVVLMAVRTSAMIASAQATIAQSPAILAAARPAETQAVLDALLAHSLYHGAAPDHAARLVLDGQLRAQQLLAGGSGTAAADLAVGGTPLDALAGSGEAGAGEVAREAAAKPPCVRANRHGAILNTHPGVDFSRGDPGLWVVVCAPDQSAPGAQWTASPVVAVGRLGGTVTPIAGPAFGAALVEQNELRARYGLEPLPDPAFVSAGTPALGAR